MPFENTDELLVNRAGTTHTLTNEDLMAEIQDTDLLLVNRSGTTYNATGLDLINSVVPDLTILVQIVPNVAYYDTVITAIPTTSGGVEPDGGYVFNYQWVLSDDVNGTNEQNIVGASTSTYTILESQADKFIGCIVSSTDARGTVATNVSRVGPVSEQPPTAPPGIQSVDLTQNQVNSQRYASNAFTTTVNNDGNRVDRLSLKAEVVGALSIDAGTSYITAVNGSTLEFQDNTNLDGVVFEVGDKVQQDSSVDFVSSAISLVGTNIDNFTTFYSTRENETLNFSEYNNSATVVLMRVANGQGGSEGSGAGQSSGGPGGTGGKQGIIYGYLTTVGSTPIWNTSDSTNGWDQIISPDPGVYTGSDPGGPGTTGLIPDANWRDYFAAYFTMQGAGGGTGGRHGSASPGAGGGGNGGNGGVRFTRVSTPYASVIEGGQSNDNYLFEVPQAGEGARPTTDDSNGGPGGSGGYGYGAGGGGGGGETNIGNNRSGRGSGGGGSSDMNLAAVTGTRFFDTAFKFTNADDVQSINVGDTFVASSGATGSVVAIDLTNLSVLLKVDSGSIVLSNTITFSSNIGKGTIDTIDADTTPPELTLTGKTGTFTVGRYLIHENPKPIKITPTTDSISTASGNAILLTGNTNLIEFANGDPVFMSNAAGQPVIAELTTSAIDTVSPNNFSGSTGGFNRAGSTGENLYNGTGGSASTVAAYTTFNCNLTVTPPLPAGISSISYSESNGSSQTRTINIDVNYSDGTKSTFSKNSTPGGAHALAIDSTKEFKSIYWSCAMQNEYLAFSDFRLDGTVFNVDDYDNTSLTFTDSTNLTSFTDGTVVVDGPKTSFKVVKYNGTGLTQSIKTGFSPDLVWIKSTSDATNHSLFDVIRGPGNAISCNGSGITNYRNDTLTSFDSDGFTLGSDGQAPVNKAGREYIAWCFDAGESTVPNTQGSIPNVSVRSNGYFSVVSWVNANTTGDQTFGHGLVGRPDLVIQKACDVSNDWATFCPGFADNQVIFLNKDIQKAGDSDWFGNGPKNDTVFSITNNAHKNGRNVVYCFKSKPNETSFGGYSGNGSSEGNIIVCGFEPAFVVVKRTNGDGSDWLMFDNQRQQGTATDGLLIANNNNVDDYQHNWIEFHSNGFQPRYNNQALNATGGSYTYMAFAGQGELGTILGDANAVAKTAVISGETTWSPNEVLRTEKSGTGFVDSVNVETNSMTLLSSNNEFVPGYFITTPQKNAVQMRGYLSFDADGNNVDLSHVSQPRVLMNNVDAPVLTFPSTFSTGEGVDTDLPYPTYLETYAIVGNDLGDSAEVKSNILYPQVSSTRTLPAPSSYRVMKDEFGEFCYWACSSDYRAAIVTVQNAEETVQELRTKAETMADMFLNRTAGSGY